MKFLKQPNFWNKETWVSNSLSPLGNLWNTIVQNKYHKTHSYKASIPVICIGNVVMGGAGKTPTTIALNKLLKTTFKDIHIISRGYGGYIKESLRVNENKHNYLQVGDESLLLSREATTWSGPDRISSIKKAAHRNADLLIMDDGLQSNAIHKDVSFLVLDSIQGVGNGKIFPAGPLRESLSDVYDKIDAVIKIGNEDCSSILSCFSDKPVFEASITPQRIHKNKDVVAFCGLGCPKKFLKTLEQENFNVHHFEIFPDHHPYTILDMVKLKKIHKKFPGSTLITTEKDWFRIPPTHIENISILNISLHFENEENIKKFILERINNIDIQPV